VNRRLVAILAADVAGYSKLMHADEDTTLAAWWSARSEIIDPLIAEQRGRMVKHTGDGFLAEFGTALGAVTCARQIQNRVNERERNKPSAQRLLFRIGINLAEIVDDKEDIHGDGVNVAARLEALAEPGGICISRDVHNQIHHRIHLSFEDLGDKSLKNIKRTVRVYRASLDGEPVGTRASSRAGMMSVISGITITLIIGGVLWFGWQQSPSDDQATAARAPANPVASSTDAQTAPEAIENARPSVAVLPFDNLSGDPEQKYFSDGMTEDLITRLAKMSGVTVIARNSSFAVKEQFVDVREIGLALGVRFVVEGSVRRSQDRLRITAQLIDTKSGRHLWAERYDRDKGDVFTLQDEVVERIVTALKVTLTPADKASLNHSFTNNLEAYDWFLRGFEQHSRFNKTGNDAAIGHLNRAVSLDPLFARAYAFLGWSYARAYLFDWTDRPTEDLITSYELARKAVELDESIHTGYFVLGMVELYRRDHAKAIASLEHALELAPDNADNLLMLGFILTYSGMPERTVELVEKGKRLNPFHSYLYDNVLGQARFVLGQFDRAISVFTRALERNPEDHQLRMWLISALAHADRMDDALWQTDELLVQSPEFSLAAVEQRQPFKNPQQLNRLIDGLRKAGLGD